MRKRPTYVFVVNNTGADFRDRFDGEDFLLPASSDRDPICTEVPIEAAQLWFGMGEDSPHRAIQRLGWAKEQNDMPAAIEKLGKFSFHLEAPKGHSTAPVDGDAAGDEEPQGLEPAVVIAPAGSPETKRPPQNLLAKVARGSAATG